MEQELRGSGGGGGAAQVNLAGAGTFYETKWWCLVVTEKFRYRFLRVS